LGDVFHREYFFAHAMGAFLIKRRLNYDWKAQFFHQMHTLLDAGISVEQAISIVISGCEKNSLEHFVFSGLLSKICTGRSLSEAMASFRDKFSCAEINVIRAAERWGCRRTSVRFFQNNVLRQADNCIGNGLSLHRAHRCSVRAVDYKCGCYSAVSGAVFLTKFTAVNCPR
jgi:type II secretory pathway component PulF